jgi:hypothetical protein
MAKPQSDAPVANPRVNEAPVAAIDEGGGTTGPASLNPSEATGATVVPGSAAKPAVMLTTTITSRLIRTPPSVTRLSHRNRLAGTLDLPLGSRPPARSATRLAGAPTLGSTFGSINLHAAHPNV